MRSILLFCCLFMFFLFTNCGDNKTAAGEKQSNGNLAAEKKAEPTASSSTQVDGIVGAWKLRLEVYDDNSNRIPDEAEMKKGFPNNYHFQFNDDGTCKIQQMFTGRYEVVKENGKDMLKVYRDKVKTDEDDNPGTEVFQITYLKKDELVLQIIDGGQPTSFWFFNRVN